MPSRRRGRHGRGPDRSVPRLVEDYDGYGSDGGHGWSDDGGLLSPRGSQRPSAAAAMTFVSPRDQQQGGGGRRDEKFGKNKGDGNYNNGGYDGDAGARALGALRSSISGRRGSLSVGGGGGGQRGMTRRKRFDSHDSLSALGGGGPFSESEDSEGSDDGGVGDEARRLAKMSAKERHFYRWKPVVSFMDTKAYNIPMLVATVFALYSGELRLMALPKSADTAWEIVTFVCFLLFLVDLVLNSIARPKYFLRLFFFLDLLATVSLVPDISFMGGSAISGELSIARAGRAARAGTRAGRLVRIFKLFKLMRRDKTDPGAGGDGGGDGSGGGGGSNAPTGKDLEPSRVGSRLSDLTTQKVILGVMLMVAVIPLLDPEVVDNARLYGLRALEASYNSLPAGDNAALSSWEERRQFFLSENSKTLELRISGVDYLLDQARLDELRVVEIEKHTLSGGTTVGQWDVKSSVVEVAAMQAGLTTFIVILLALGAALFSRDANKLVIAPIERMVGFVKNLADNPAAAAQVAETGDRRMRKKKYQTHDGRRAYMKKKQKQDETSVIEQALAKIGTLLQIGFGEAGAAIITKNLQSGDQLNAMVPGEKMRAVFGFCDIRNFTDTTECLQEEVMPFTNFIANIVHTAVKDNFGAPNKNIGDAFLLVWKLPADPSEATKYADGALRSFLRIIDEIDASTELRRMVDIPSIRKRMPNYRVKMGFGLHLGWGIEGAIGSMHKIDASYLSPHVNLAARLESGTKMYGKELLLSDAFVRELSAGVRSELRKIDRVTVKGSIEPMVLYTYDIETPSENSGPFTTYEKYRDLFHKGYEEYVAGNWSAAGGIMERCLKMWPNDEPARGILWYMSRSNFRAPASWEGYRALDSK